MQLSFSITQSSSRTARANLECHREGAQRLLGGRSFSSDIKTTPYCILPFARLTRATHFRGVRACLPQAGFSLLAEACSDIKKRLHAFFLLRASPAQRISGGQSLPAAGGLQLARRGELRHKKNVFMHSSFCAPYPRKVFA
jgi:hypothetical protein